MPTKAKSTDPSAPEESSASQRLPMKLDVRIGTITPNGAIRATASVNMNDCFAVKNIKVMDGKNGLFVSMPSYKAGNGEYKEHCFPITKGFREQLNEAVLSAYHLSLSQTVQTGVHANDAPEVPEYQQSQSM